MNKRQAKIMALEDAHTILGSALDSPSTWQDKKSDRDTKLYREAFSVIAQRLWDRADNLKRHRVTRVIRRMTYENGATFVTICEKCKKFVKADKVINFNGLDELKDEPNATCTACGRVKMIFEGFV